MQPLESLLRKARAFLLPSVLLLGGCLSGTETGTENTVVQDGELEGRALLSDGKPAALASVMVRTGKVEISANGLPSWKLWSMATADSQGRFKVQMPRDGEMFLEIRESPPPAPAGFSAPFPEVGFIRVDSGDARPKDGLKFGLAPSGSLQGRLELGSGRPAKGYWLGIKGSSSLVALDTARDGGGHPFHLDGVHAGRHDLSLLFVGGQVGTASLQTFNQTFQGEVKPESNTDLGTIFYNDSIPAPEFH